MQHCAKSCHSGKQMAQDGTPTTDPLRDLAAFNRIADEPNPKLRRAKILDWLEAVARTALGRTRTFKGVSYADPDCNGATHAIQEAIPLLTIDAVPRGTPGGLADFERKPTLVKAAPK